MALPHHGQGQSLPVTPEPAADLGACRTSTCGRQALRLNRRRRAGHEPAAPPGPASPGPASPGPAPGRRPQRWHGAGPRQGPASPSSGAGAGKGKGKGKGSTVGSRATGDDASSGCGAVTAVAACGAAGTVTRYQGGCGALLARVWRVPGKRKVARRVRASGRRCRRCVASGSRATSR
jgi:hypothetical protein